MARLPISYIELAKMVKITDKALITLSNMNNMMILTPHSISMQKQHLPSFSQSYKPLSLISKPKTLSGLASKGFGIFGISKLFYSISIP